MPAPRCQRIPRTTHAFGGHLASYLEGVTAQWLRPAPHANPAMLEIFRDRDRLPRRNLVPWAGEFAGKYLTSAVQILRLTGDDSLKEAIADGRRLRLCDFASAGEGGSPYISWLKVRNAPSTPYSPVNPLCSGRV